MKYFWYFILFNFCFLSLQFMLVYSHSDKLVHSIKLPLNTYLEFLGTLSIHCLLYILLSAFQTWLLLGILKRSWHHFAVDQWQLIIWSLCVVAILSANTYYFPLSIFSKLFSPPIPEFYILICLCSALLGLASLVFNALFYRSSLYFCGIFMPIALVAFFYPFKSDPNPIFTDKPNIIILGIDSLSPENVNKESMPFLYDLVHKSLRFTNSISPLARTYPAWSSILTGLYPKNSHADENLVAKNTVDSQASIVWKLKQQGYNTIYATDDRRFNSIDTDFGFQEVIGPKLGVNDIILGTFNDFPLGNLLINARISSWFFPYNYSNRASYFSYYPVTFNKKLQTRLAHQPTNRPIFLAVHFALPHWPYAWAKSSPEQVNNEFSLNKRDSLYQRALKRVDKQFASFYLYLQHHHYLTNSLLIILSDHGEVLYYPNSRLTNYQNYQSNLTSRLAEYFKTKTATDLDKSAGHGSDILSPRQYHNLLAFNIYKQGRLITKPNTITTRVALIDLAPTIIDFLKMNPTQKMDGISLFKSILNPKYKIPNRVFFIESGMFPNQEFSKEKAIALGHKIYKVNPVSGELELKKNELIDINQHKLFGVISGNWVLALYPDDQSYIPVIQNLRTGEWVDDLHSDFAKTTPAAKLTQEIKQFYGKQLVLPIP